VDGLTSLFLPKTSSIRTGENVLSSLELAAVSGEIQRSIQSLKNGHDGRGNVFLVIDQLDLLLAAGGERIGEVRLGEMLMGLREVS
jgi:elongator complex protein 6